MHEQQSRRLDDAILAYRRAMIANPKHPGARDALRRLNAPIEDPPDEEADEFEEE
ncbi:MAG: hypothetical protein AB1817_06615 [Chloroflexota bacterium]